MLVAVALALVACGGGDNGDGGAGAGGRLPDLTLAPLQPGGSPLELGALEGPAVVNLWATWCAPCRQELPDFQQVAAARPDVRFVGVDVQENGDARAFLDDLGITFEQFVDDRGTLAEALGVAAMPVTLVIGDDGRIVDQHLGPMTAAELDAAIDSAG